MSQKLWVAHATLTKTFIDKVSIDGCEDIADFLNSLYNRPLLAIPQNTPITLYQPDGTTEIDVGDSPSLLVDGNSRRQHLIVRSTLKVLISEKVAIGSLKQTVQTDTADLKFYAPVVNKKSETINLEIKSGKIKRAPKRCTTCGLENHPQCKKPSGGVCNTPTDQYVPYKKSRGNRSKPHQPLHQPGTINDVN